MLTGNLVRIRQAGKNRLVPLYLDPHEKRWLAAAERMLELFRQHIGKTRGELEENIREAVGDDPGQLVFHGLSKLLQDRCEFEIASGQPPELVRAKVFQAAARARQEGDLGPFDRTAVLKKVANELEATPEELEASLFADLKSEQRITHLKDLSGEHLLERYNLALAQAILLRATKVHLTVRGEQPRRYRALLRRIKFHRLMCEMERIAPNGYLFHLDGPLSLFTSTQKYGLQLALFLPAVLRCKNFELEADLRWGAQRRPKTFALRSSDGLTSLEPDMGVHLPAELQLFADLFGKKVADWKLEEETDIFPLGNAFWVPDFRLTHRETDKAVWLEVLGFWRKSSAEKHLQFLRKHAGKPYILAVSDQLKIDDESLDGFPAGIHRFRSMPLPEEIALLADKLFGFPSKDS
jgi:predicted nuclease of restriction endonuclease-like RecB superfamily